MSDDDMFYCSFVSIHYIICECGETFPTEDALKNHLEKEHPHKRERKEYKCGVCAAIYSTEEACVAHYKDSHIVVKNEPEYEDQDVVKQEYDYDEYAEDEGVVQYEETIQDHIHYSDLGRVYRAPKSEKEYSDSNYSIICEVCGQIYVGSQRHYCYDNNRPKEIQKFSMPTYSIPPRRSCASHMKVVCEVCGKKYASNAALRYHQRLHTGERPYKCSICTKSFTMPLFLQIHHRTHTGERPFKCSHSGCPKAFSNKAALLRHDRVHTGEKPYKCPQCGKRFSQSNSMKLHVHTVHLKLPTPYKSKNRRSKRERLAAALLQETSVENIEAELPQSYDEGRLEVLKTENIYSVEDCTTFEDEQTEKEVTYEVVYE